MINLSKKHFKLLTITVALTLCVLIGAHAGQPGGHPKTGHPKTGRRVLPSLTRASIPSLLGIQLNPAPVILSDMTVWGVAILQDDEVTTVVYVATSQKTQQQLYNEYKDVYKRAKVRWRGLTVIPMDAIDVKERGEQSLNFYVKNIENSSMQDNWTGFFIKNRFTTEDREICGPNCLGGKSIIRIAVNIATKTVDDYKASHHGLVAIPIPAHP